jgi:ABC-type sugar transport system substrate-binding protein
MLKSFLAGGLMTAVMFVGAANADPLKIGLVQIDLSNPFHVGEVEGAKEAARRYGFDLRVTSGEGDVNKQIQAFENLINEKVDAIAVNFIDVGAFGPAMAKAKAANIPVVCLHSRTDGCAKVLGFDERFTGRIVGEYAVKLLEEKNGAFKGQVANLQGLLGQGLNTDRSGGFTDVTSKYSDIKLVAQEPTNWDPNKAVQITENWLTAYPKLDLIYGNSDSLTVPAGKTLKRADRTDILLVSVDGSKEGLDAVKSGMLKSTVLLAPQYSGFWKAAMPYLVAAKKAPDGDFLIQGVLVTKENVDAMLKIADDMVKDAKSFPFDKPLKDVVAQYSQK